MNTGFKDRYGTEIKLGSKFRPYQDGIYGRLVTVVVNDSEFYVDVPDYKPLDEDDLKLSTYLYEGNAQGWEFEIIV